MTTAPPPPNDSVVAVDGIVKRFGERTVLRGLTFGIARGSATALVGPSGGGKSTLLRCMTGLEPFDEGSVRVVDATLHGGRTASNAKALHDLRRRSGLVFQQWHLFPHMTALENVVEAPVHVLRRSHAEARKKAEALLEEVGLAHRMDAMPRQMSGGEQQRCAIARALAMDPEVLFMDEPTSALDPQRVGDLVDLLLELRKHASLTLVIVTHEMAFAQRVCDRALVLYEGTVIEDGAPSDVLSNPRDPRTRSFLGADR
ncbi:MAG: amino acid ABC transporter ATP-binding protein [Polyangiales bacterium]